MITPQNIVRHEFIGLQVSVETSPNKAEMGLSGLITDETKNTFLVKTGNGVKTLEKQHRFFRVVLPDDVSVVIDGNILSNSPSRRVSMRVR